MIQFLARVDKNEKIGNGVFLLWFNATRISDSIKPGQFLNIKVNESFFPLLRRPFSVCDVNGQSVAIMFNVAGEGTRILSEKKEGDYIDVLGPLGNGFSLQFPETDAVFIAGGLGAAPFPYLQKKLNNKQVTALVGGRSSGDILTYGLSNVYTATEDGSSGFKGNVIQLFDSLSSSFSGRKLRIFTCGPNRMIRALKQYIAEKSIIAEASVESAMACGFGICQGCPIEHSESPDVYKLICKDGPVFNLKDITI